MGERTGGERTGDERSGDDRRRPIRGALVGVALIVAGAFTLGALVFVSNSPSAGATRLMMSVGLAGSALLSAIAQGLVFGGAYLLWKAAHRSRA